MYYTKAVQELWKSIVPCLLLSARHVGYKCKWLVTSMLATSQFLNRDYCHYDVHNNLISVTSRIWDWKSFSSGSILTFPNWLWWSFDCFWSCSSIHLIIIESSICCLKVCERVIQMIGDDACHVGRTIIYYILSACADTLLSSSLFSTVALDSLVTCWDKTPNACKYCIFLLALCQMIAEGHGMCQCIILEVEILLQEESHDFIAWHKGLLTIPTISKFSGISDTWFPSEGAEKVHMQAFLC